MVLEEGGEGGIVKTRGFVGAEKSGESMDARGWDIDEAIGEAKDQCGDDGDEDGNKTQKPNVLLCEMNAMVNTAKEKGSKTCQAVSLHCEELGLSRWLMLFLLLVLTLFKSGR